MLRLLALVLVGLLLFLQLRFWGGSSGWHELQRLQGGVESQRDENERLRQRNDALAAEVEDLKEGQAAVEERARAELGLILPGEVFYRVVEDRPPAPGAPGGSR